MEDPSVDVGELKRSEILDGLNMSTSKQTTDKLRVIILEIDPVCHRDVTEVIFVEIDPVCHCKVTDHSSLSMPGCSSWR